MHRHGADPQAVDSTEEAGIASATARKEAGAATTTLAPSTSCSACSSGREPDGQGMREHGDLKSTTWPPGSWGHGLDLETVRAEVDRLVDEGVLPGPQPSDGELLATLGIDLKAVMAGCSEPSAGRRTRRRPSTCGAADPALPPPPRAGPLSCWRPRPPVAATRRRPRPGRHPRALLLGLLGDAETRSSTDLALPRTDANGPIGLPDHGPSPVRHWSSPTG